MPTRAKGFEHRGSSRGGGSSPSGSGRGNFRQQPKGGGSPPFRSSLARFERGSAGDTNSKRKKRFMFHTPTKTQKHALTTIAKKLTMKMVVSEKLNHATKTPAGTKIIITLIHLSVIMVQILAISPTSTSSPSSLQHTTETWHGLVTYFAEARG